MKIDDLKNQKEFGLSTWSVNNRKTVYLITFIIGLGGLFSYMAMPKENFPELAIPEIYVGIAYPGYSPELIADKIAEPIEKELNGIKNVDEILSTSIDGYASIRVKFNFNMTAEEGLQEVKDAVDQARSKKEFPDLPIEPNIFEMDISEMPIMNINLSGDYSTLQLKEYAEKLEDLIENLDEISAVDIRGTQEREMIVEMDHKKAAAVDVSFNDIQQAIQRENITMSGGDYLDGKTRRTVKFENEFKTAEELGELIVKQENYKPVKLKNIAEVKFTDADTTSFARERGMTVVMLDVKKRSGKNLLDASDKIHALLKEVRTKHLIPDAVDISVTNDQSGQTREMVDNLVNSIISGVILVVGILLFFLGLRNSLFVGIAIPMSMFMSFLILQSMGVTLNVMVLFSLVLALGMLVDNGIVVVENVQRLMEEGHEPFFAVRKGVGEIAWPIISSTATTVGAFLPLAFWPGIMGEFMKYLPITLMIVLTSSLFVALVINPVFLAIYMKLKEKQPIHSSIRYWASGAAILFALPGVAGIPGAGELLYFLFFIIAFTLLFIAQLSGSQSRKVGFGILLGVLTGFFVGGMISSVGMTTAASLLFFGGVLSFLSQYLFIDPVSPFKLFLRPAATLIGLGILYALSGSYTFSNFLMLAGFGILMNKICMPMITGFQYKFLPKMEAAYEHLVSWAVERRPILVFVGTIGLFFFSFVLLGVFTPKVLFFPEGDPKYVNIFIQHPIGTDINVTNETTKKVEQILEKEVLTKYLADTVEKPRIEWIIQSVIAQVGDGTSDPTQGPVMGNTPHKGRITVNFAEFKYRGKYNTRDILNEMSEGLSNRFPADVQITVSPNKEGPPTPPPVNIELSGEVEYSQLIEVADSIRLFLDRKNIKGVDELKLDVETGKPELPIVIDRDKAEWFNTSTYTIANNIRSALFGLDVSTYKLDDEVYDIVVRFDQDNRNDIDELLNQKITFMNNKGQLLRIPIHALIEEPKPTTTYSTVVHKNQVPVVSISSNVSVGENPNEVVEEVKSAMADYESEHEIPTGVAYKFTGEQDEQAKEMAFLSKALYIALGIVLLIIVGQFNGFTSSLVIMMSVPLSFIGVLLGEVFFQMDFVIIMTMIGIISLAGVVVNNAIVLIDYTNVLRRRRREELGLGEFDQLPMKDITTIIAKAGRTRLRPVLLTAITTVLGLVPLAMGINIDFITLMSEYNPHYYMGGDNALFFGPMSWTIIFGLTFATFLTLVVIPVMYLLSWRLKVWIYQIMGSKMRTDI